MLKKKSKKRHILHVIPGLGAGGMELAMARVISGLTGDDFHHSIACLKGEAKIREQLPDQTDIYYFHTYPNEPKLPIRLGCLIRKIRPNVIHARNWGAWPDVAVGRFLAFPPPPLIYSFHGLGRAGYMPLRRRAASNILVNLTSHLFTVSRQSRNMLVKSWGWPKLKTKIIPNGVDTQRFFPKSKQEGKRIIIGSVGNLRTVKNHALILKASARLINEGWDIEVRIAGEGNQRASLTKLAGSLNMGDRFHLVGRTENVPDFLNSLDIFVLSSDSEQHPNALNEAMACGVASIATNVGCVEDLMDKGRCGRIISPNDDRGLYNALLELIRDKDLRVTLGRRGLHHVRTHYSLAVMVNQYRELYLKAGKKYR